MTREARLMTGIILITVSAIQYSGHVLLTSLMNKSSGYSGSSLDQSAWVSDFAGISSGKARRSAPFYDSRLPQAALPAAILTLVELWTLNVRITGSDSSRCRIASCTFWYSAR